MTTIDKSKSLGPMANGVGVRQTEKAKGGTEVRSTAEQTTDELNKQLLKSSVGVDLSARSKDRAAAHRKAYDIAKATPDVRADRVADLRQKIASGEYKPDSEKIADGILREAIMDQLAALPDEPA